MKNMYEKPEVEVVSFEPTDIIAGVVNPGGPSDMGGDVEIM